MKKRIILAWLSLNLSLAMSFGGLFLVGGSIVEYNGFYIAYPFIGLQFQIAGVVMFIFFGIIFLWIFNYLHRNA